MNFIIVSSRRDGKNRRYYSANELSPWTQYVSRAARFTTTEKADAIIASLYTPKGATRIYSEMV